jgi:FixJ family two-component response regulator
MMDGCTIYFVDSDDDTRRTLRDVTAQVGARLESFSHAKSFLRAYTGGPGCLVAELQIEDMNGLELQKQLAEGGSRMPVVFVAANAETQMIVQGMQNGAITVLQKPASEEELCDAVMAALVRDREIRRIDAGHRKLQRRLTTLTPREKDVLDLIMAGLSNKVIAKRLGLSLRTVESRRQRIFQKTKCSSVAELAGLVFRATAEAKDQHTDLDEPRSRL